MKTIVYEHNWENKYKTTPKLIRIADATIDVRIDHYHLLFLRLFLVSLSLLKSIPHISQGSIDINKMFVIQISTRIMKFHILESYFENYIIYIRATHVALLK